MNMKQFLKKSKQHLKQVKQLILDIISLGTPQAILIFLILALIILSIVSATSLEQGPSISINKRLFPFIFETVLNIDCPDSGFLEGCCPSCGLTRATSKLLHGDVKGAWGYNPLVFPVMIIVLILIIINTIKTIRFYKKTKKVYPWKKSL